MLRSRWTFSNDLCCLGSFYIRGTVYVGNEGVELAEIIGRLPVHAGDNFVNIFQDMLIVTGDDAF